jgi:hypothetical protein
MADIPGSKPPFWSSLHGIITALGGAIVAVTGLITALYSTGVIGSKANTNTPPLANTALALSAPYSSPSPNAENDLYKQLVGTWEVEEQRPKEMGGAKVTWVFEATVSGNVLTLRGKVMSVNGKVVGPQEKDRAVFETKMVDSTGGGFFEVTDKSGVAKKYPASIRLLDDFRVIHGRFDLPGNLFCGLMGKKL